MEWSPCKIAVSRCVKPTGVSTGFNAIFSDADAICTVRVLTLTVQRSHVPSGVDSNFP